MPAPLSITLNQLALALLGAGAYIYYCRSRGGYWKACALVCGQRIERDHPSPYAALAATAAVLLEYEAQQAAQDAYDDPAARAAYRTVWAASAGQPVAACFAAAQAAARAAVTLPLGPLVACPECDGEGIINRLQPPHLRGICPACVGSGWLPAGADDDEAVDTPSDPDSYDLREYDSGNWVASSPYEDEAERLYRQEQRIAHEQYHPHH